MKNEDEYTYTKQKVTTVVIIAACAMIGVIVIVSTVVWVICRLVFD